MRFKVIGTIIKKGERCNVEYGDYPIYSQAYDYKKWLENPDNWKDYPELQPYMVTIIPTNDDDVDLGYDYVDNYGVGGNGECDEY